MADVNYITDKNGNKVNIADLTARTNASTALLESEYNRQLADNVYAGRDLRARSLRQGASPRS